MEKKKKWGNENKNNDRSERRNYECYIKSV